MYSWQGYFDKIFVLNLPKRVDRLQRVTEIMNEYEINAFVFEAIEHEKGALGLVATMKKLFADCLESEFERVVVFEDDVEFLECPEVFHQTMDKCVVGLHSMQWQIFYLGIQHVRGFGHFRTPNILPVNCGYSTHAVAYSKNAMEYVVKREIQEPIDNFLVREFQPMNTSFCVYPLLATQANTFSDICKEKPDWDKFIRRSYDDAVRAVLPFRFNH